MVYGDLAKALGWIGPWQALRRQGLPMVPTWQTRTNYVADRMTWQRRPVLGAQAHGHGAGHAKKPRLTHFGGYALRPMTRATWWDDGLDPEFVRCLAKTELARWLLAQRGARVVPGAPCPVGTAVALSKGRPGGSGRALPSRHGGCSFKGAPGWFRARPAQLARRLLAKGRQGDSWRALPSGLGGFMIKGALG